MDKSPQKKSLIAEALLLETLANYAVGGVCGAGAVGATGVGSGFFAIVVMRGGYVSRNNYIAVASTDPVVSSS